eukprot:9425686-Prorocentrum_lima.AAC.1
MPNSITQHKKRLGTSSALPCPQHGQPCQRAHSNTIARHTRTKRAYTKLSPRKTAQAIEATAACKLGSKSYMLSAKHSHPIQLALLHT